MNRSETFVVNVQSPWYEKIVTNEKTVESRINDEFYSSVKIGDHIIFRHVNSNKEFLGSFTIRKVVDIYRQKSFQELLSAHLQSIFPGVSTIDEGMKIYDKFYLSCKNEIDQFGVVGFKIKLTS